MIRPSCKGEHSATDIPIPRQQLVRHVASHNVVVPYPRRAPKAVQVRRLVDDGPEDNRRNDGNEIPSEAFPCLPLLNELPRSTFRESLARAIYVHSRCLPPLHRFQGSLVPAALVQHDRRARMARRQSVLERPD